jgi:transcription factor WhiB
MGRFSCSLAVFRRSWPGAYGIYVGSAAAALTCRGAACLLAHAPLTIPAIPTTCPPSFDDITTRTGRGPDRPPACPAAILDGDECGCFPKAPGAGRRDLGLAAAGRVPWAGRQPVLPSRPRARTRAAAREERAKQVCRTCPVMQQCRRHALSVREPYGVWGGLSKSERDALLGGGHRALRVAPPGSTA